jgi:hypothetical protein
MKIVEQQMMDAVVKKHSVRLGTTYVNYEGGVSKVYFYGTQIAEVTDRTVRIRNCGHTTSTTKSRLNAILLTLVDDKWIYQKNNVWYISGDPGYRFDSAFLKGVEGEWIEFSNDFLLKSFVQQD